MLFDSLLVWPDQLPQLDSSGLDPLAQASIAIRSRAYRHAESLLLVHKEAGHAHLLLAHLRLLQHRLADLPVLLQAITPVFHAHPFVCYLQAQYWLLTGQYEAIQVAEPSLWSEEQQEPLLALAHAAWCLRAGLITQAQQLLSNTSYIPDCPERVRLQARVYQAQGDIEKALTYLQPAADRAPQLLELQHHLCELLLEANRPARLLSRLRQVIEHHGEAMQMLPPVATAKLLQRQPGLARRAALLHRLKAAGLTDQSSTTNQLICYEQTGHSDWLEHLTPELLADRPDPNLLANLVMQLASVESPRAAEASARFCGLMQLRNQQMGITPWVPAAQPSHTEGPLRIVWLSGDVCDHPVGRFLLGFFHASQDSLRHQHILVSWADDNPFHEWFDKLNNIELLQVQGWSATRLIEHVRALNADLVVDLAGWTAKNFGNGFLARLAPLQVNYLGYFASTGNPSMDTWLGDSQLFPDPMREWHSEAIHRLPRCFIAWQPPPQLPEANLPVPPAPLGGIRFGSFNHNRKFSDRALRLWGRILTAIPSSSLVLKATATGDEATLDLLISRMRRCGLDPTRVIWLPLVAANADHLLQYGQMDVALDCLPNGGCTTTCEALWMGVPVITLTGHTYVSRMSTAVLHGAGLQEWCATREEQYVQLAVVQAERLQHLRAQRSSWRERLKASRLGDATDLMRHLEQAFGELHQRRCTEQASSR